MALKNLGDHQWQINASYQESLEVSGIPGQAVLNPDGSNIVPNPNVIKTILATASGNTAIWTPASGKKFRLMRYLLELTQNAAQSVAGVITVELQDATTGFGIRHSIFVPGAAATVFGSGYTTSWVDLGRGQLSALANNVLNINLSSALTAGNARIIVVGREE